ncbi:MAG: hypothetical protein JWM35_1251, partial [Verrucomicrobia bacterium]|nr:hypothetical protein [Verrucomicrobiota bacterium]
SPGRGERVVVVTTREKFGTSATSRSQSVLFPEPAGPASTRRTGVSVVTRANQ